MRCLVGPSVAAAGAPGARGAAEPGRRIGGLAESELPEACLSGSVDARVDDAEFGTQPPPPPPPSLEEKGMPCFEVLQNGGRSKDRLSPTSASRPRNPDSNRFLRSAARNSAALLGTPPILAAPALPFEPLPEPASAEAAAAPPRDPSIATGGQRITERGGLGRNAL